jgi:ribulose-phosphate 3-epimerase
MPQTIKIAPSLLSANFAELGLELKRLTAAGADWIHIDVMDGHFVPNMTIGPQIVKHLRPHTDLPFDVHLMIEPVDPFLKAFADAGADHLIIHPESGPHLHRSLQTIHALGKKAGIALNPATSPEILKYVLDDIDLVLVMTVNPGFGGQSFIESQLEKIRTVRQMVAHRNIEIVVDGGVTLQTAPRIIEAGASALVAGTAIFHNNDYQKSIAALRHAGER